MTQPCCLLFSLIAIATSAVFAEERNDARPPNVIIVLADDLSYDVLSCYGGESVETPNLDKLAAEGMRYTHCFSPALCMPSRCELLTGKYSHRNFLGRGNIAEGEANIASELKKAGYATCQIEKWHLNIAGGAMPPQVGFDEYYHTKLAHNYADPVVDENGTEKTYESGYGPAICQSFAFDFIEKNRKNPFFIYYAIHLPHAPYHAPPASGLKEKASRDEKYQAMVEHMDTMVGELKNYLESLQLRKNTLLIFLGDNGTPKGIHYKTNGERREGGKASPLDSGTRVPMIVNWPGTAPSGVVTDNLIDFADFLPTLMNLEGKKPTKEMQLDGQSFHRQILGESNAPKRKYAFKFGCQNGGKGAGPTNGYWARTQDWKLYHDGRLFDMTVDSKEENPFTKGEANAEGEAARKQLQNILDQSGAVEATKRYRAAIRKKP